MSLQSWEALLPPDIARAQSRWEWEQSVLRAIDAGASRQQIARLMGGELRLKQFEQRMSFEKERGRAAPVIVYFQERRPSVDEIRKAEASVFSSRQHHSTLTRSLLNEH